MLTEHVGPVGNASSLHFGDLQFEPRAGYTLSSLKMFLCFSFRKLPGTLPSRYLTIHPSSYHSTMVYILTASWQLSRYSNGLRAGRPGFDYRQMQDIVFSSSQRPGRLGCPPSLRYNANRELFPPGAKRPRREADHSPPASTEDNNGEAIPPLQVLME
jgi:hypothetical protein